MSMLPKATIEVLRTFNDIGVTLYGVGCTLFVPTNLTALEPNDAYTAPVDTVYWTHYQQTIWIEWHSKEIHRLRKLGVFSENEAPITARFNNHPIVTIGSYVKIESQYIPDSYDTDEFEVVDVILEGMYNMEVYRWFKMAPRRAKS